MSETVTHEKATSPPRPLPFIVAKWYGYVFSTMFLLYGGVKMIFGWLDHDFSNYGSYAIFFAFGSLFMMISFAFRDQKSWGWYGLTAFSSIASVWSLFTLSREGSLALLVLSIFGLVALLWPSTRRELFGG